MLRYTLQLAILAAAVLYAWQRGGSHERSVAAILVAMAISDPIYHAVFGFRTLQTIDLGHLVIDLAAFTALTLVALREGRCWTLLAASAQLISLLSHLLRVLHVDMGPLIYAILTRAPSYMLLALLLTGTLLQHWRSCRRRSLLAAG